MPYLYHGPPDGFLAILGFIIVGVIMFKFYRLDKKRENLELKILQLDTAKEKQDNGFTIYEDDLSALSDKEFYEFTKQKRTKKSKTGFYVTFAIFYIILLYIFN